MPARRVVHALLWVSQHSAVDRRARAVTARDASHRPAAGRSVSHAVQRSAGLRDRAACHRSLGAATRRDGPRSAHRATSRLLGADDLSRGQLRRQAVGQRLPQIADAQKFATGAGVTVAVIDTGVNGSPRVPALPGGDFVDKAGDGMNDCDSHGTLTASIIAGRAAPDRRLHRRGARRPAPVAAPDVGQLSAGGCAHRPERPQHHPHRRLAAQPRPRDRARGQPRRAGDQHQRGGLLQDHPPDRREEPRRRHRVRGQRQGRGHHRRGGQHRAGLRPEPAARRVDTRRIPAAGSRFRPSSRLPGTRRWC